MHGGFSALLCQLGVANNKIDAMRALLEGTLRSLDWF